MPRAQKGTKAIKAKVEKAKIIKAKPALAAKKTVEAKPTASPSKAPKALQSGKPEVKASSVIKARKARRPNKAKGTFADLLKKQAELEEIKKGAKADLKKQFDSLITESENLKTQYKELFNESIEAAPKARGTGSKKTSRSIPGLKPFSLSEVEDFIEQKQKGSVVKIQGRRPKSVARLEDAFKHSEDAKEMLKILNK